MRHFVYLIFIVSFISLPAQDKYILAEESFFEGKNQEALSIINQKAESEMEAQDFLLRAIIHESLNFLSNANDDFIKAVTMDSEFYEAYFHYSEFLCNTKDYEKAIASLTLLLNKIDQGETKGIFFKIDQNGLEPTSVTSLTSMTAEILTKRSNSYQQLEMLDMALVDINRAIIIDETAGRLVNRSLLFSELNQNSNALQDLKNAVALSPKNALAWYNLFLIDQSTELPGTLNGMVEFGPMLSAKGVEAMELGDYEKAADLFDQALVLTPRDPNLLLNSGRLDFKNQQFSSARDKFERAIEIDSSKTEALYLLGNAHFGQGDFKQALEQYSAYLKTDPTYANVWFNSGMAYLELSDAPNACMCLNRASDFGMKQAEPFISEYCTKE